MQPELKVRKILGKTYLNENRLADALDVFSKILADYPDDVETLHILGNFYLASGDGRTAKKIYLRAQQADPNNPSIQHQIQLAEEANETDREESVPTDFPAVARLLQRLTGRRQAISETEMMRAAALLEQIIGSESPADLVSKHLDEIDELLPALIELNIRQAFSDGRPELAESLRNLQLNIDSQLDAREDGPAAEVPDPAPACSRFSGSILFLSPAGGAGSHRMALLKATLKDFGCSLTEKREYLPGRDARPDVVIAGNPHWDPALLESLSTLSMDRVPIILDLDTDFEKQPISHPEYDTKGLGSVARSNAYTTALSLANIVTVPSEIHADSLRDLVESVSVIPDGWSTQNGLWQRDPHPRNTINIGWLGEGGQLEDLVSIRRFIMRIIREFSNTRVVIIGDSQAYRLFDSLPGNRRMYLPAVARDELPYQLGQLDVLLVPLRNTPFNLSQPDTVLVEAGAKGVPWVASPIPAFRRWQHGGMIAGSADEWHLDLRHLVMDEELRRKLGQEGRSAAGAREMKRIGRLWLEVIERATQSGAAAIPVTENLFPSHSEAGVSR